MRKELSALHAKIGGTMIYVTHDQVEAMTLADKIVVLRGGRVEQAGLPLDLYNTPQNVFVAGFIGSPRMNLIEAQAEAAGEGIALVAGRTRVALPAMAGISPGDKVVYGIRPEHLELTDTADAADFSVTIDLSEQLGGETYLYCNADGIPQLTVHQLGQLPIVEGQVLNLRLDRSRMHLFGADGQVIANGVVV
jgi:multiple sugar transport system ATP-binding protein